MYLHHHELPDRNFALWNPFLLPSETKKPRSDHSLHPSDEYRLPPLPLLLNSPHQIFSPLLTFLMLKIKKLRFRIVSVLTLLAYLIGVITLFTTKSLILPLVSFILLFILLYFFAIDRYRSPKKILLISLGVLMIAEILIFALGKTRHFYLEIVLLNLSVGVLCYQLFRYLKTRLFFSPFPYFTEGGYMVAAVITLLVSVVMIGKYTQIPFTCEDINNFLPKILSFSRSTTPPKELPPISVEKSEIELFFERIRTNITTEAVELQESMSKNSCEFVMTQLKKTQINQGFQIAVLLLMYFLLIGVFKIVLRIINFISFALFILLKPFKVYRYEKEMVEKKRIK